MLQLIYPITRTQHFSRRSKDDLSASSLVDQRTRAHKRRSTFVCRQVLTDLLGDSCVAHTHTSFLVLHSQRIRFADCQRFVSTRSFCVHTWSEVEGSALLLPGKRFVRALVLVCMSSTKGSESCLHMTRSKTETTPCI